MVGRLVIHAGDYKTGSTSIQSALARGLWEAPGARLFYPALRGDADAEKTIGNHRALARAVQLAPRGPARRRAAERRMADLARRLAASDAEVGVISAERFERVRPEVLRELIAAHMPELSDRLSVVIYVRPHAERLLSGWAERLKHGRHGDSLKVFARRELRGRRLRYARRLARWREAFGEALTVRPFLREHLAGGDVVRDFLQIALRRSDVAPRGAVQRNRSPSARALMALRVFHEALGEEVPAEIRGKLGIALAKALAAHPLAEGEARFRLHRALAERVREACAEDAASVDAEWFADLDRPMSRALERAVAEALPEPMPWAPEAWLEPGEIRLIRAVARGYLKAREMRAGPPEAGSHCALARAA